MPLTPNWRTELTDNVYPRVRASVMFGRALIRRCPFCGTDGVFASWFRLNRSCTGCGLKLQRNEESDYWTGGYLLNFIVAELIVALCLVMAILISWPNVPWNGVLYGTAGAAIIGPLLTFPFARTLWIAIDLIFRPAEASDFEPRNRGP